MIFSKLGFRSLFRQKRRTLITLTVIMFGIGCLLLTTGHSVFILWGLRESMIHSETGHLQVFNRDFLEKEEDTILQYGLDDAASLRQRLEETDHVQLVQARIELMGLISNGEKSVACLGTGVEPGREKTLRELFGNSGTMYDSLIVHRDDLEIAVLGVGLARSLNARVGDWLTMMSTTADGALNAVDVKVVDTFDGGMAEYNERAIILPLKTAQILLNTPKVKKLLVTLDRTERTTEMKDRIKEMAEIEGYRLGIREWHEAAAYYKQVKQFYQQVTGFMSIVLFIIVFFSVSNTVVMSIIERTTEIGTLLSMGTSRWQTLKMFFFEGLFLGIAGAVLSAVFALGLAQFINAFDILLPPPPGFTDGYPLGIRSQAGDVVQIGLFTVLIAVLSSLGATFRVTRMKIVDALGHI